MIAQSSTDTIMLVSIAMGTGKDHFFKPIAADAVAADESEKEIKDNLDECLRVMEEKLQIFNSVQKGRTV